MVEYRITKRVQEQYTAFMEGFNELIPQELINVFDERELELLIGGISESTPLSLDSKGGDLTHTYSRCGRLG